MPSQPAPWTVYREYVHPRRSRFYDGLIQHRALSPLKYGDALWSVFFASPRHKPSLIFIAGSLVPSTVTGGLNQAMSAMFAEEDSTFYSLPGFRWDRGWSAMTFLSPSNL